MPYGVQEALDEHHRWLDRMNHWNRISRVYDAGKIPGDGSKMLGVREIEGAERTFQGTPEDHVQG